MTKKKTRKSKTKRKRSTKSRSQNRTITLIITAVVVILGGYYLLTGSDPLGLFKQVEETPPPAERATPPPAVVGSGGDWWQVYFTDPQNVNDPDNLAGSIPEKLIGHINQAQNTIHIASFNLILRRWPKPSSMLTIEAWK